MKKIVGDNTLPHKVCTTVESRLLNCLDSCLALFGIDPLKTSKFLISSDSPPSYACLDASAMKNRNAATLPRQVMNATSKFFIGSNTPPIYACLDAPIMKNRTGPCSSENSHHCDSSGDAKSSDLNSSECSGFAYDSLIFIVKSDCPLWDRWILDRCRDVISYEPSVSRLIRASDIGGF